MLLKVKCRAPYETSRGFEPRPLDSESRVLIPSASRRQHPPPPWCQQQTANLARRLGIPQSTKRVVVANFKGSPSRRSSPTLGELLLGIAAKQAFRNYKLRATCPLHNLYNHEVSRKSPGANHLSPWRAELASLDGLQYEPPNLGGLKI